MTHEAKLAARRARWHRNKHINRADRLRKKREWHHKTKHLRKALLRKYDQQQYWKHRGKRLLRNKAWRIRNRKRLSEYNFARDMRRKGITVQIFNAMLIKQEGLCAICKNKCSSGRRLGARYGAGGIDGGDFSVTGLVKNLLPILALRIFAVSPSGIDVCQKVFTPESFGKSDRSTSVVSTLSPLKYEICTSSDFIFCFQFLLRFRIKSIQKAAGWIIHPAFFTGDSFRHSWLFSSASELPPQSWRAPGVTYDGDSVAVSACGDIHFRALAGRPRRKCFAVRASAARFAL